jgi:menaquinol-cytochrome c reductase iron-sulfur subunit
VAGLVPLVIGLAAVFDPLRRGRGRGSGEYLRLTTLSAVPDDGVPRQFPVVAAQRDAWTFSPDERIGAVYLRRLPGQQSVEAFNVVCPHAGCFVGYDAEAREYRCPCHTSAFTLDGEIIPPSPAPRGMDQLPTRVTKDGVIEVAFANYYPGRSDRIEKA